jgi:hypothetical protein
MMMRMVNPFTSQRVPLQFSGRVWRRYRMAMLACVLLPIVALVPACGSPSMPLLTSPEPEPEFSPGGNSGNSPVPAEASGLDRPDAIIEFDHLSLQDGLSQSVILDILQDSRGFIWFATQDGLNRFDGYEFKIYKHDPEDPTTLSNNFQWSDQRRRARPVRSRNRNIHALCARSKGPRQPQRICHRGHHG